MGVESVVWGALLRVLLELGGDEGGDKKSHVLHAVDHCQGASASFYRTEQRLHNDLHVSNLVCL